MHSAAESCLPMETEAHAIALDSAATCDACLCLTTILQRCVYPATRCQAPLVSRRPLFAPCLPSTCSSACVQSPCGSLRFITLTVLNRGEVAVVGHCKFAEMLYSSDELVVVVCFFSKTASILYTTATGRSVKSVYAFVHYAFGGVSATRASPLWHSTSASGPTRRVSPPRGSPPRCPSRAFPSSLASSPPLSLYEAFLIPRFVACGPSSGVAHSPFFIAYLFLAALSYTRWVPVPGQTDVFPVCVRHRFLHSFSVCHLFCLCVPRCLVVQDVFPDRVQVHEHFRFCVFLPLL